MVFIQNLREEKLSLLLDDVRPETATHTWLS